MPPRADADDVVAESDELNNSNSATINCSVALPDLVITRVAIINGVIYVDVKNAGSATAGASQTRIIQTNGDSSLASTPALAPGATTTVAANCGDGEDSATATADATGVVAESNESNNSGSGSGSCFVNPARPITTVW